MAELHNIKYMPLSNYSSANDPADTICAVEVSNLFGNGLFPDWSRRVTLAHNTTYTVGSGALAAYKAGYIWCGCSNWNYWVFRLNGTSYEGGGWFTEDGHDCKLITLPVSTGDSVYCSGYANFLFLPLTWSL